MATASPSTTTDSEAASPKLASMQSQIRLDMTSEGLRIQIVDADNRPMFDSGSSIVKPYMRELLQIIASTLALFAGRPLLYDLGEGSVVAIAAFYVPLGLAAMLVRMREGVSGAFWLARRTFFT